MISDEEKIVNILRYLLKRKRESVGRVACPDEETLAGYLAGVLMEDARDRLETHLASCSICLEDIVAAYKAAGQGALGDVPQQTVDKVKALFSSLHEGSLLDIVVRLAKGSLELVSTSGQVVPLAAPVSLRRGVGLPETTVLQIEKEMGKFKVNVEVEQVGTGLCQVVVRVTGKAAGNPAEGIRLSLFSEGRERASYVTRNGEAAFDRLPQGEYNLAVSDSGTPVGTIRLRIDSG